MAEQHILDLRGFTPFHKYVDLASSAGGAVVKTLYCVVLIGDEKEIHYVVEVNHKPERFDNFRDAVNRYNEV